LDKRRVKVALKKHTKTTTTKQPHNQNNFKAVLLQKYSVVYSGIFLFPKKHDKLTNRRSKTSENTQHLAQENMKYIISIITL
jgi:hypothetical protein